MFALNRFSRFAAVSLTAALALVGCGSGGVQASNDATPTDSTIPTFVYGLPAIPDTLDVANDYNGADMAVMSLVTQPLETPNLDGTFRGVLAQSVSQPDATTLVYDLREGVKFSDGKEFKAVDAKWSIDHLAEPTTQTGSTLSNVASAEVTGEYQVTLKLVEPNPATRGEFAIISFMNQKEYGDAKGELLGTGAAPPIGTGPYVIDEFNPNKISLSRNTNYNGDEPAPEAIQVTTIADDNAGQLAMRSGALDALILNDVKFVDSWKSIGGVTAWSSPTLYLDALSMDNRVAPFNDVHVRRAVAYATDLDGLRAANYGDEAEPPVGYVPDAVNNQVLPSPDSMSQFMSTQPNYPFDMEKAKEEMALSAYPNGFDTTFEYYLPVGKTVGVSLASNLKELGINLEVKPVTMNEFYGRIFTGQYPPIGYHSISSAVPDPSGWYKYFVGTQNMYNFSQFSSPTVDSNLTVIDEGSTQERWDAITSITAEIADQVPYVQLAQPNQVVVLSGDKTFTQNPDIFQMFGGDWINHVKSTI